MTVEEFEELKTQIKNKEIEIAKNQGILEKVKKECIDLYGTCDLRELGDKQREFEVMESKINKKLMKLEEKIQSYHIFG